MTFDEFWNTVQDCCHNCKKSCSADCVKCKAERAWEAAKTKWMYCKDAMPTEDEYVLWLYANGFIFENCIDKDDDVVEFLKGSETSGPVIAWMPLPEVPDINKNNKGQGNAEI